MIEADSEEDIDFISEDILVHEDPIIDLSINFQNNTNTIYLTDDLPKIYIFTCDCAFERDALQEHYGSKFSMRQSRVREI